ncbi:MAG: hypothetical protein GF419_13805 [Ignavibacteriales bacterium]|nr:hypothetical protein [Ignavibacteriales bacterium]
MTRLITLSLLAVALSACAPIYVPNTLTSPLFAEQGDVSAGFSSGASGSDFHVAAALTDEAAIMANASIARKDSVNDDSYHEHEFYEGAIGYFLSTDDVWRFETYAGYGEGTSEAENSFDFADESIHSYARGSYRRYFAQFTMGMVYDHVEAGFGGRFSYVDFYEVETAGAAYSQSETGMFVEPAVFLRFGLEPIKIQLQIAGSVGAAPFEHETFIASAGVAVRLNALHF